MSSSLQCAVTVLCGRECNCMSDMSRCWGSVAYGRETSTLPALVFYKECGTPLYIFMDKFMRNFGQVPV